MTRLFAAIPFVLGGCLIAYVFTLGNMISNHSLENHLLLSTGLVCIAIGCLAAVIVGRR
jgi:hypothetical protein